MENKSCNNCRFGHDGQARLIDSYFGCCSKTGKYYNWMAKTDAQILEDLYYNRNKLVGDISTGYTYLPTVDLDAKKFNDMLQGTINKTKELQATISGIWNDEKEERTLKEQLNDQYGYLRKENKMKYNFPKLEKFCKDNDIKFELDLDRLTRMARFIFSKNGYNTRMAYAEERLLGSSIGAIENYIIYELNKTFIIKEENKMEVKKVDYQRYYAQGSWRERIEIKDVKFNGPCTIVFWTDGDKTIVKCTDETFDKEKGLAMAIAKKFLGTNESKSNYCNIFKKFIPEDNTIEKEEDFMNPPVEDKEEKIFSIMEYAKYFGVSEWKVRQMIKNGELNASKNESGYWKITV